MQKNGSLLKSYHQACLQGSAKQTASLPSIEKKKYLMEIRHNQRKDEMIIQLRLYSQKDLIVSEFF